MAKEINCQCGATVSGETDDELVAASESHMEAEHPNLVGKMSRDQILSMVTPEPEPEAESGPEAEPEASSA